eukprot:SAG22_NODE_392_length_11210_cov_3.879669_8_plen_1389_part_00
MGALETGAMPYAKGLIDHQWMNYVRYDGMINYRAEEVAQQARMLTILALYYSYSGGDAELLLKHFAKAKTMADWLIARRAESLQYGPADPRYGVPPGVDEGDDFKVQNMHQSPQSHWYPSLAEAYRAFTELGEVWVTIGRSRSADDAAGTPRGADVAAHGAELLKLAPLMYRDLHASLNRTVNTTASPGHRCYPHRADGIGSYTGCNFRAYPEMFYSGALTAEQTDAMYTAGLGLTTCETGRWLTMGSPAGGSDGRALIFVHIPQGMPYGLLVHDMVDRFLLYFFTQSAHSATRGTYFTPESQHIDRNAGGWPYASPGQANVPMALKWMLCFEEPETRTLWLAKATPRDWLVQGEAPLLASNLTTRYGRVSFRITTAAVAAAVEGVAAAGAAYTVHAGVSLPPSFAAAGGAPAGGIRLRIRAPPEHAGKLSHVTVGGKAWSAFSAAEETIDIAAAKITASLIKDGLPHIVATFAGAQVPLRAAHFDPNRRIVPVDPAAIATEQAVVAGAGGAAPAAEAAVVAAAPPSCPGALTRVDTFQINGTAWAACEDLQRPAGDIVLMASDGTVETFAKTYEPYLTNASDSTYYLGLTGAAVANATADLLGLKLLAQNKALSWAAVERAVPPIRSTGRGGEWGTNCQGVRTFVGSRGSAYDGTLTDSGQLIPGHDWDGCSSVMQPDAIIKYNLAVNEPPQKADAGGAAEGMVGDGRFPAAFFYLPMVSNGTSQFRYWTKFVVATADMKGSREQDVWTRYQQVECAGPQMAPPCKLHPDSVMYWDTYWFANYPGANATDAQKETLRTGPVNGSSAGGFYGTLLENRRWWAAELAAEGMMALSLPSPASTNGTQLVAQSTQSLVKAMITRESTWHPRTGVSPGYGSVGYNGLSSVFVATATAALESGALPFAEGVIWNWFAYYVRDDGMVWHTLAELPANARTLTVLALYHSYSGSGGDSSAFLLQFFGKAKALADLLIARHTASLRYGASDPRYGIPAGGDDALHLSTPLNELMNQEVAPKHWYASAAEFYRACTELGAVWASVGKAAQRPDVAAHGAELLALAPQLFQQLHASLNKTAAVSTAAAAAAAPSPGRRCYQQAVEAKAGGSGPVAGNSLLRGAPPAPAPPPPTFRGFAEMMFSGALSAQQVDDIYTAASGGGGAPSCSGPRLLVLGSPAGDGALLSTPTAYGLAYGLLQHDMVERFLLTYFSLSAHAHTRGGHMTPEHSDVADRSVPAGAYAAAGQGLAPTCLKWMLCFEEPGTRTLWLAKATPRDWLAPGEAPLLATNLTTRYGRVSFSLAAPPPLGAPQQQQQAGAAAGVYAVHASLTFPSTAPPGGIRLRLRAPPAQAGKLSKVTVGGKAWAAFSAAEETVDFAADQVGALTKAGAAVSLVATWS